MMTDMNNGRTRCDACLGDGRERVFSRTLSGVPECDETGFACDPCDGTGYLDICDVCDEVDHGGWVDDSDVFLCRECHADQERQDTRAELPVCGICREPGDLAETEAGDEHPECTERFEADHAGLIGGAR